jgi:tetratricopeptide (TPR) repeat protein
MTRELGNRASESDILDRLGKLAHSQGKYEEAELYFEQALAIARQLGVRADEGSNLYNLGYIARIIGRPEEAADYFERALAIFDAIGAVNNADTVRADLAALHGVDVGEQASGGLEVDTTLREHAAPSAVHSIRRRRWWPFGRRGS